jgi:glycosyltransferase involved in cell wall biosynthesis
MSPRRILLFDWTAGGHHARYLQQVAAALSPIAEIVAAAPDALLSGLDDTVVRLPLGAPRPALDYSGPLPPQNAELAAAELDLFERAVKDMRVDHAIHLYADPVIRRMVRRPPLPTRVSLLMFFVRWHSPRTYGDPMSVAERARGWFQWGLIERWRRRRDAHALFLLDENAVRLHRRLSVGGAAEVFWFPEPPVVAPAPCAQRRAGVALFGSLAERKGLDLVVPAIAELGGSAKLTLAGNVEPQFANRLETLVAEMRGAGVEVDLRARAHTEEEGLGVLARARRTLVPYPRHYGMSRVLLESAVAGTPVIANRSGLIGRLVEEHGLGEAVDCADAAAFAATIRLGMESEPDAVQADWLRRFAARYSADSFCRAVRRPFGPITVEGRQTLAAAT